jgi:hypothetical protein
MKNEEFKIAFEEFRKNLPSGECPICSDLYRGFVAGFNRNLRLIEKMHTENSELKEWIVESKKEDLFRNRIHKIDKLKRDIDSLSERIIVATDIMKIVCADDSSKKKVVDDFLECPVIKEVRGLK